MKSSSDSFNIGGFNYVPAIDEIAEILNKTISFDEASYSLPGVFTIPICQPPSNLITFLIQ